MKKYFIACVINILLCHIVNAENGYDLWLNYNKVSDQQLKIYEGQIKGVQIFGNSKTINICKEEFNNGLNGMLDLSNLETTNSDKDGIILVGKYGISEVFEYPKIKNSLKGIGNEGFYIYTRKRNGNQSIIITANEDIGVLYGTFYFLQLIKTGKDISNLDTICIPKINIRVLNHWDNINGTIERGYAGLSLWNWEELPDIISTRYQDYARANASIGINGTVLNNVNANPLMLEPEYLKKVAVLADIFRPYGLKVYMSIKFSSPINIGGLKTADPLDPVVQNWWKKKVEEIYSYIPDFGGFLVKANSEGQPGPQNYNRSHAEGANMLAEALAPHGGIVMWRAFVYDNNVPEDRAKQAFNEFKPLDGQFKENVLVQVKNGPIDFQPREPFHPLFGAMSKTPLMMEFQITQEYLGQSTDLVYLSPLFKECLNEDTYAKGTGSTVAKVIDGTLENHKLTGIAGVANTGNDLNWTGHIFGQANWYAFGRLAWNYNITSAMIAEDWIKMTLSSDKKVVSTILEIMMTSRENAVNSKTPLGLHHIMGNGHHFGPGPWVNRGRPDWTSVYYHKADSLGIGFDRTSTGSDATSQYFKPVAEKFANLETCPDEYLLWFHHLPWNYTMRSGKALWEELCLHYYKGVDAIKKMQEKWNKLEGKVDQELFEHVKIKMTEQVKLAEWWRNSCVLYFQQFSKMPIPRNLDKPVESLDHFQSLNPTNYLNN